MLHPVYLRSWELIRLAIDSNADKSVSAVLHFPEQLCIFNSHFNNIKHMEGVAGSELSNVKLVPD